MRKEIAALIKKRLIADVTQILPTAEVLAGADAKFAAYVRANARVADVFRFSYRSSGLRVFGYMALPKKLKNTPCIIYNRGGSFDHFKMHPRFGLARLAHYASWGYVVIGSQYRGNDGGDGREEWGGGDVDDIIRLRAILRALPGADATRIGMLGHSRGGMMTYLTLSRVRWLRAAVTLAGLADEIRSIRLRPEMKKVAKRAFGLMPKDLGARSAVRWPEKFSKKTPLLMLHGTADWRVTPLDSLDLSAKLIAHKVPHRLVIFEGADHSLHEVRDEATQMTRAWLDRFVRDRAPLPDLKPHGE